MGTDKAASIGILKLYHLGLGLLYITTARNRQFSSGVAKWVWRHDKEVLRARYQYAAVLKDEGWLR